MFDGSKWRENGDPADQLFALDSFFSKDDFSKRAAIYEQASEVEPLKIDYIIQGIDVLMDEHIQVTEHVSDTFGIVCFGKAPLRVTYTGVLADTDITYGKQYLIDAYKNKLRLGAVSRTGKVPAVKFANYVIEGPFIKMHITETTASECILTVIMTMIVTSYQITGEGKSVVFDYIHGVEDETNSAMMANATDVVYEDDVVNKDEQVDIESVNKISNSVDEVSRENVSQEQDLTDKVESNKPQTSTTETTKSTTNDSTSKPSDTQNNTNNNPNIFQHYNTFFQENPEVMDGEEVDLIDING